MKEEGRALKSDDPPPETPNPQRLERRGGLQDLQDDNRRRENSTFADLAAKINTEHKAAHRAAETAITHAIRAGELLLVAKERVDHGQWLAWISDNCDFSARTATGYMRLANLPAAKRQRVADFSLRQALAEIADPAPKVRAITQAPPSTAQDRVGDDVGEHVVEQPRQAKKNTSRVARWAEAAQQAINALEELVAIQEEFQNWRDNLNANFDLSATAEKLDALLEIDLQGALEAVNEAAQADLPLGFGRDG